MAFEDDTLILVDAHVHLRSRFNVAAFARSAYANFRAVAKRFGRRKSFLGVLLLADSSEEKGFDRLLNCSRTKDTAGDSDLNGWRINATKEDTSIYLVSEREQKLLVVAGRQLVSREQLEVLAIGTRHDFAPNTTTERLIHDVTQTGGLPVVPWGVGKWMGGRRRLVERLLQRRELPQFFVGDSANRPRFWPKPELLRQAEERGIRNLPGSDLLPFAREFQRVGSYGCILQGTLDHNHPTQDLEEKLRNPSTTIRHFGKRETPFRFVRNQAMMQYRKLTTS